MNPIEDGIFIKTGADPLATGFQEEQLQDAYYRLTADAEQERLILESANFDEIDCEYGEGEVVPDQILEAIRVRRFSQTESRMKALARVFGRNLPEHIEVGDPVVGKPRRSGLFATVTVRFPLSDGQSVSIVFHSPEGSRTKIQADEEIVAFRFLLNKRDITQAVSPEHGKDISLSEIGKRISQIVEKNSGKFQANRARAEKLKKDLEALKKEVAEAEEQSARLNQEQADLQETGEDLDLKIQTLEERLALLKGQNDGLREQIEELKKRKVEAEEYEKARREHNKAAEESSRLAEVGRQAVPGVRSQDAEQAGRMWEMKNRGELTQDEWDEYVRDLKESGKIGKSASDDTGAAGWDSMDKEEKEKVVRTAGYVGSKGGLTRVARRLVKSRWNEIEKYYRDELSMAMEDPDSQYNIVSKDPPKNVVATVAGKYAAEKKAREMSSYHSRPFTIEPVDAQNPGNEAEKSSPDDIGSPPKKEPMDKIPDAPKIEKDPEAPDAVDPDKEGDATAEAETQVRQPEAVKILDAIINGDYADDMNAIDQALDKAAEELEAAGIVEQYEEKLNQAADVLTEVLKKKAV